jgi:3-hydroxyisobutyrate dehydrogenase-like beta-hydroxyacid dehydrogenase
MVPLGLKDVEMALDAAERVNVALPIANLAREHLIQALAQGYGDNDWSVIGRVVANALVPPKT